MELKFRAWDKEIEDFIYSDATREDSWFEFQDGKLKAFAIHGMTSGTLDEPPQPNVEELEEPELYTGLEDENGNPIFEGDILNLDHEHDTQKEFLVGGNADSFFDDVSYIRCFYSGQREIIGSRFETPDLLVKERHETKI